MPKLKASIGKYTDSLTVTVLEEVNKYRKEDFDGIIFSGSPLCLTELNTDDFFPHVKHCLDMDLPILGVCFGHQLLGAYFGAKVFRHDMQKGDEKVRCIAESPLFKDMEKENIFSEIHEESITLPDNFEITANSDNTKIEAMQHKTKPIYSVQFHPEKTEGIKGIR